MRKRRLIALAACIAAASSTVLAQRAENFKGRLEWVPIGGTERNDVAGEGDVSAQLTGSKLAITGKFSGLPGKATGAKLHIGVARGARGRGEAVADLAATSAVSGAVTGEVQLSADQIAALKIGRAHV